MRARCYRSRRIGRLRYGEGEVESAAWRFTAETVVMPLAYRWANSLEYQYEFNRWQHTAFVMRPTNLPHLFWTRMKLRSESRC